MLQYDIYKHNMDKLIMFKYVVDSIDGMLQPTGIMHNDWFKITCKGAKLLEFLWCFFSAGIDNLI